MEVGEKSAEGRKLWEVVRRCQLSSVWGAREREAAWREGRGGRKRAPSPDGRLKSRSDRNAFTLCFMLRVKAPFIRMGQNG